MNLELLLGLPTCVQCISSLQAWEEKLNTETSWRWSRLPGYALLSSIKLWARLMSATASEYLWLFQCQSCTYAASISSSCATDSLPNQMMYGMMWVFGCYYMHEVCSHYNLDLVVTLSFLKHCFIEMFLLPQDQKLRNLAEKANKNMSDQEMGHWSSWFFKHDVPSPDTANAITWAQGGSRERDVHWKA